MLTKTERVLDRDYVNDKFASFTTPYEDGSVVPTYIELDRQTFEDFGSPEQITVTVVAGDRLNDDFRNPKGYL